MEQRRILDQRCEKLSHDLGVLEREVDKCRRLFYDEGEPLWLSFKSMYASG
jgi:hypothetical protein